MNYCQNCGFTHNNTVCPYCHGMPQPSEVDRLRAQIAELQADKERLIWLLKHCSQFECRENVAGNAEIFYVDADIESIDAARKEQP